MGLFVPARMVSLAGARSMADPPPDDDLPDELPPLDGSSGEADEPKEDAGLAEFAESLGDEETVDLDDEEASELDIGVELHHPLAEADDEPEEMVLDIGNLLDTSRLEPSSSDGDDDQDGPVDFDTAVGVDALPEEDANDDAEGATEELDFLVSEDLPSLDADETGDFEDGADFDLGELAHEDEPPPWARRRWQVHEVKQLEACSLCRAVDVRNGLAVFGGSELHWAQGTPPTRFQALASASRVHSLILLGTSEETVLWSTETGELWVRRTAGAPERVEGWREVAGLSTLEPVVVELRRTRESADAVLGRLSGGRLLRSVDAGLSWNRVELHAEAVAVGTGCNELLVLAKGRSGTSLLRSSDAGSSWDTVELDQAARRVADGSAPIVSADGDLIVLADPVRGLVVSADGGNAFSRVPGCARVTALACGNLDGTALAWAALHREADDVADICIVDPHTATARRVASTGDTEAAVGSTDALAMTGWIGALCWDAPGRRLWAVGGFGVATWSPPAE